MAQKVIQKVSLEKSKFFVNLPGKIKIFPVKIEIFWKFAWKIEIFGPGSTTPQISNQIDAAGSF